MPKRVFLEERKACQQRGLFGGRAAWASRATAAAVGPGALRRESHADGGEGYRLGGDSD